MFKMSFKERPVFQRKTSISNKDPTLFTWLALLDLEITAEFVQVFTHGGQLSKYMPALCTCRISPAPRHLSPAMQDPRVLQELLLCTTKEVLTERWQIKIFLEDWRHFFHQALLVPSSLMHGRRARERFEHQPKILGWLPCSTYFAVSPPICSRVCEGCVAV